MGGLTTDSLRAGIGALAPHMVAWADDLNAADGRLGDGDLGITMQRGMAELAAIADDLPDDLGMAFLACAKAFTRVSGSSYGTLLATGLMSAAKACKGRTAAPWSEIPDLLAGAQAAMMKRGKAALGDKTVLDGLDAMRAACAGLDAADIRPAPLRAACERAAAAALDDFRDRQSKLGRARMYGAKSVGLDDPGMLALQRVVEGLSGALAHP